MSWNANIQGHIKGVGQGGQGPPASPSPPPSMAARGGVTKHCLYEFYMY